MEVLTSLGMHFLIPALFVVGMIVLVLRRGLQMKLLLKDGIETTATVVRKLTFSSRTGGRMYRIRYQYVDQMGRTHSHRSAVDDDVYRSLEEGSPFPIVYSQSKPHISAPKDLVEQSRAAMAKRSSGASAQR